MPDGFLYSTRSVRTFYCRSSSATSDIVALGWSFCDRFILIIDQILEMMLNFSLNYQSFAVIPIYILTSSCIDILLHRWEGDKVGEGTVWGPWGPVQPFFDRLREERHGWHGIRNDPRRVSDDIDVICEVWFLWCLSRCCDYRVLSVMR